MEIFDFAESFLAPYQTKGAEIVPELCPYCHGGNRKDKHTFALNTEKQTFNCKRGKCGKQGHYTELLRDFGVAREQHNAVYSKPKTNIKPLSKPAQEYLELRKISRNTMDYYGVGDDGKGNIVFPFYSQSGELEFVKFRPAHKVKQGERKAWRESGTKPILFGMNKCVKDVPLVICEGEIDALSCAEAGILNAVSVPSGASDLSWLNTCWDFLEQYDKIYLFGDNDEAGREMIEKVTVRLSHKRVYNVQHRCKDANELLYFEGVNALAEAYDNAREVPPYGLIELADVAPLEVDKIKQVPSGIKELDSVIGGFTLGDLSVWTGRRGEGKSTLLSQVCLEAVDAGENVCAYSGELDATRFQYWINLQAAGEEYVEHYIDARGHEKAYVPRKILDRIKEWYRGRFWLYDNKIAESSEEENIIRTFELAAKRYGCKVFMVDNLMTARYAAKSNDNNYYRAQSSFVGRLVEFANKFDAHVHLVAHPRKVDAGGKRNDIENDDIAGTADITNRAANVFSLEKLGEAEKEQKGCDSVLKLKKNRWEGARCSVGLNYSKKSKRLYMPSVGEGRKYGWDRKDLGWIELAENTKMPI